LTRRLLTSLVALALAATSSTAAANCKDEWICIDALDQGNEVDLRARNLGNYPITYTLSVRSRNLHSDGPMTVTRTLAPQQSERVMTLTGADGHAELDYNYSFDWSIGDKDAAHDDNYLYALPYASGRSYRVLQGYGSRFSHTGLEEFAVDLDMPIGTAVHAARAGVVARIEESHVKGCWDNGCGDFANFVVILHSDGTTGEYYHLRYNGVLVAVGDSVAQGQKIAYSGNTGHTTMPHLHFAVYRSAEWGDTQSIPVRFQSVDGIITRPRRGARYQAM